MRDIHFIKVGNVQSSGCAAFVSFFLRNTIQSQPQTNMLAMKGVSLPIISFYLFKRLSVVANGLLES